MFTHDLACSRRSFLQLSSGAAGALVMGGATSLMGVDVASAAPSRALTSEGPRPANAVVIDANENPLGPCTNARESLVSVAPQGGRYSDWLTTELVSTFCSLEDLKAEYVRAFPGSGGPLHYTVLTFTSPTRSYVTADPGYEAGMHAAK